MKTTMKKLLSFVLVAVLLVSAIPFQASAATTDGNAITMELKFMDQNNEFISVEEKTVEIKDTTTTPRNLLTYKFDEKWEEKYTCNKVYSRDIGADRISLDDTVSAGDKVSFILVDKTPVTPTPTEKPAEPASKAITMKILFNDDTFVSKTLTHEPSNGVSSTIVDLLDYVYDTNWRDTYEFVRANNSTLGTVTDINSQVLAGESINIRLKEKVKEVKPIEVIVKVESSDNVVWTGSKVPANDVSSKVEDLLSYCWNKDWDNVYEFDHAWSHEQQKNVDLKDSVKAGDTLYIMVNKLGTNNNATTRKVTFYDVNGTQITSVNVANGGKVHVSNFEDAAKYTNIGNGYSFSGWKIGSNGTTTYTNTQAANLTINGDTSFYAVATKDSSSNGGTTNKFPYKVYLHIYKDNKVDEPAKTVDITSGIALDGKVTLGEVKTVVKNYYTAKTSDGIGYDGLYLARGSWVNNFVNDTQKYSTIEDTNDMRKESEVHINVMITNANAKTSTSSNADSSNPKTGDSISMTITVMTISASALALVYFFNKKRAIVK